MLYITVHIIIILLKSSVFYHSMPIGKITHLLSWFCPKSLVRPCWGLPPLVGVFFSHWAQVLPYIIFLAFKCIFLIHFRRLIRFWPGNIFTVAKQFPNKWKKNMFWVHLAVSKFWCCHQNNIDTFVILIYLKSICSLDLVAFLNTFPKIS